MSSLLRSVAPAVSTVRGQDLDVDLIEMWLPWSNLKNVVNDHWYFNTPTANGQSKHLHDGLVAINAWPWVYVESEHRDRLLASAFEEHHDLMPASDDRLLARTHLQVSLNSPMWSDVFGDQDVPVFLKVIGAKQP